MTPHKGNAGEQKINRRALLRKGAMVAGGLSIGTAALSTTASADRWDAVVDQTGIKFDRPAFVSCLGEPLTVTSGTARFDTDVRPDAGGGFHVNAKIVANTHAEGDQTGDEYVNSFAFNRSLYSDADRRPFTKTASGTFTITGKGQAPDLRVQLRNHMTFTANGDLAVDIAYRALECRA